jgi:predicted anti-sigma-YlaC factor YlaD
MKHKPFKNWILDDTPLSKEEKILLKKHLQMCPQCRQLNSAWKVSEQHMKDAIRQVPQPGFTQRFQSRLLYRKEHEKSKLIQRNLILLVTMMVLASAIYMLQNNLFAAWVVSALSLTTSLFFSISKLLAQFNSALNRSPVLFYGFTLLTFGAILSLLTSLVFLIWNLLRSKAQASSNEVEN